jgi:hypothetical protein
LLRAWGDRWLRPDLAATGQGKRKSMSIPAKTVAAERAPFHRLSDSEILLFVSRTLRPQLEDDAAPSLFGKLQSLKDMLDRLDAILADVAEGYSKDRMTDVLASAKSLLAQIADDLAARIESAAVAAGGVTER